MSRLSASDIEAKAIRNRAAWPKKLLTGFDGVNAYQTMERVRPPSTKTEPTPHVVNWKPVKAAKKAKPCPTESQEQCAVIAWADTQPLARFIFAIPNGANKSMASAVKFKREGLRKGVPDLFLPIPNYPKNYHGLFIEMKRIKASVTSKEQLAWINFLQKQNFACGVCHGADEAIELIQAYLK